MSSVRISAQIRMFVADRANHCCEYCKLPNRYFGAFTIDHVIPTSKGGDSNPQNLAFCCSNCNAHKATRQNAIDPFTGDRVNIFNPRQQIWHNEFNWSVDRLTIIGVSAIGRATVVALDMNRETAINLRELLYQFGQHPPLENEKQ